MRLSWQRDCGRGPVLVLSTLAATLVAGCSSSGRFSGPSWNLTGKGVLTQPLKPAESSAQRTGLPAPERSPPVYRGGRDPVSGRAPGWGAPPAGLDARSAPRPSAPLAPAPSPPARTSRTHVGAATGPALRTVEVRPGQTLAMIATEQRVSIVALMTANRISDPYVIPGQMLVVPQR